MASESCFSVLETVKENDELEGKGEEKRIPLKDISKVAGVESEKRLEAQKLNKHVGEKGHLELDTSEKRQVAKKVPQSKDAGKVGLDRNHKSTS